jgi:aspartyl protease family protein
MGLEDRDWYREVQRERKNQRQLDATKNRFANYSKHHLEVQRPSALKNGFWGMLVFWFAVMGVLYVGMTYYTRIKPIKVITNGEWVIPRAMDGHFYVAGSVNGMQVNFLIDTGASLVTVTDDFAQKAVLVGGTNTTFETANGPRPGRIVADVPVSIGSNVTAVVPVGIGLSTQSGQGQALLGQSFLSKFDVTLGKDRMTLRSHN